MLIRIGRELQLTPDQVREQLTPQQIHEQIAFELLQAEPAR